MTLSRAEAAERVEATFPQLERIEDDELRQKTVDAWVRAMRDNDVSDLAALQWFPPAQTEYDLGDVSGVDHIRDVTALSVAMAEQLDELRAVEPSVDLTVAGALLHDISKCYEFEGMEATPVEDLIGHPYYGVAPVYAADLPVEIAHVVLSHTSRTRVEPAILEAEIIHAADEVAAETLVADGSTELGR
jgi:putative nucleotidyltransferase with HDIG domain